MDKCPDDLGDHFVCGFDDAVGGRGIWGDGLEADASFHQELLKIALV